MMEENWKEAKKRFDSQKFPEKTLKELMLDTSYTPKRGEKHELGKGETHDLDTYTVTRKVGPYTVDYVYKTCNDCKKIIAKYGVLLREVPDRLAYITWFIRKGELVNRITLGSTEFATKAFTGSLLGGDLDD